MRQYEIRRQDGKRINAALKRVNASIVASTDRNNMYSRGLSREGYQGGYAQALSDVLLVLNGVRPNTRDYWDDWKERKPRA